MSDTVMIRELRSKRVELQKERAAIDAKLAAITTVIDMFEGKAEVGDQEALTPETSANEPQMSKTPEMLLSESEGSSANGHPKKIAITQEVRKIVQELEGPFKTQDVVQEIRAKYPRAEIHPTPVSTALGRMVKREEGIRVVSDGGAWEPNIYERVSHDDSSEQENPMST